VGKGQTCLHSSFFSDRVPSFFVNDMGGGGDRGSCGCVRVYGGG